MNLLENIEPILQAIGGLGLFLLGVIIMTDGLGNLVGNTMRSVLMRFTNSPLSGAFTGTITTAVLQSSSAITVAAVGFVGAGLITFSESLGIIFGANVGTTITGWIVALLGFKLQLGNMMMLFLFLGVLLRLFAKKNLATFGYVLAGFSIIFIGITMMQEGMGYFSDYVSPSSFPHDSFSGRLKLVAIGIVFTIITQSSSAGIAVALTALFAGTINFEQAAALAIGMDVGTTVTAALATIGQSIEARRTGFSHVIYNIMTAIGAFFLITPFTVALEWFIPAATVNNAELSLVAFHTTFNFIGLIAILPFTKSFSTLMFKLVPETKQIYTDTLDDALLQQPHLALTAVQNSINSEIVALLNHLNAILGNANSERVDISDLQNALNKTHNYIDEISLDIESGAQWERLLAMIHTMDHMQRLHERCEEEEDRAITLKNEKLFIKERDIIVSAVSSILEAINEKKWHKMYEESYNAKFLLYKQVKSYRTLIVQKIARGELDVEDGTDYLEGVRWLKRVIWHIARISYHYEQALLASGKYTKKW